MRLSLAIQEHDPISGPHTHLKVHIPRPICPVRRCLRLIIRHKMPTVSSEMNGQSALSRYSGWPACRQSVFHIALLLNIEHTVSL